MTIRISTPSASYPVLVDKGAIADFARSAMFSNNSVVITDDVVEKQVIASFLPKKIQNLPRIVLPSGEAFKRLDIIEQAADELVKLGATRETTLIAIGGGVVGDMSGLLASLYMRGMPVVHVPTTLLAMVDSSLGGKTGVDTAMGKNLLGTFYQPTAVVADAKLLQALPEEQFITGMAEVIKHGIIHAPLFHWLEKHIDAILARDLSVLAKLLQKNIRIKKQVVERDETEQGARMILNLGHTFGHAIEHFSDYAIPHGEGVAIGTCMAASYAESHDAHRIAGLFHAFGLPTNLEVEGSAAKAAKELVAIMQADKKRRGNGVTLILPHKIGDVRITSHVPAKNVQTFLQNIL